MKLIAQKPCGFGGKLFYIGEEIPVDLVIDPKKQEAMGVLAIAADESAVAPGTGSASINVVIPSSDGEDFHLQITPEGLQTVVNAMVGTAESAKTIIEQMTEGDALILLNAADNRKAVKAAAEARAKSLIEQEGVESAGDQ